MSLFWTFLVAALGAGVGTVLALTIWSCCYVGGTADQAQEAYEAGYAAAAEHWRRQLERAGEGT